VVTQVHDELAAMLLTGIARRPVEPARVEHEPATGQRVLVGPPGVLTHGLLQVQLRERIGLLGAELASEDKAD